MGLFGSISPFQLYLLDWNMSAFPDDPKRTTTTKHFQSTTQPGRSDGKEPACNAGDLGSVHGLGRSLVGGNGNPF